MGENVKKTTVLYINRSAISKLSINTSTSYHLTINKVLPIVNCLLTIYIFQVPTDTC